MGNLKARIKATLFRRESNVGLSPSASKASLGQDYASSANTHTRSGHDAPDDRVFSRFRGRNRGLSQEQPRRRSNLVDVDDDKSSVAADSYLQTPVLTPDIDATAYCYTDRPQDDEPSGNRPQAQAQVQIQAQCTQDDFQADGAERSMIPASSGPGSGPGPGPRPAQAHDSSSLQEKTSANAAPLILRPDLASTPLNFHATAGPGNDRHNLGASSGPSTSTHSRAHSTAVTTAAAAALAEALAPISAASAVTAASASATATTAATTTATAAAPTNLAPPATNGPPTLTNTDTDTGINTNTNTNTNANAITRTGTTLPRIDKNSSATPRTISFAHLEVESGPKPTLPEPLAPTIEIEQQDDILGPIYSPINSNPQSPSLFASPIASPLKPLFSPSSFSRPSGVLRRQSILPAHQSNIARALLNGQVHDFELDESDQLDPLSGMATRKIWVKRPMASATIITINEDDLVDDVREQILRKYANSLGRQYDAPDLTLRICNREQQSSRPLQPDEPIAKVIDTYYTNGQSVDDALLIDIPSRRTPKASPNPRFYADDRPHESGTDYFPPFQPSAHVHHPASTGLLHGPHPLHFPPAMSIVAGSQLPPLPSPGSARRQMLNRPNMPRTHTVSPVSSLANAHPSQMGPTTTGTHKYSRSAHSRTHSAASSDQANHAPAAPTIPTPPPIERTATPPPRVASPLSSIRMKKKRAMEPPSLPPGLLDIAVPPINILIVEDNMINLRLLEAFVKRLKVRWQTAVNGKEAVDKWRAGGFHLVLMDIQLPIMNGLEATREIRRIEKANSIGVFSSSASSPPDEVLPEPAEEDKLANYEMFKSPVIIVALTASSLQSDRHEALAAGCNDFLTKPVNFDWLQRKVKEWGCMQALIDFDSWRKWKDFSQKTQANDAAKKAAAVSKVKPVKKSRVSTTTAA